MRVMRKKWLINKTLSIESVSSTFHDTATVYQRNKQPGSWKYMGLVEEYSRRLHIIYVHTCTFYVTYESELPGLLKFSGKVASYLSAALPFPPCWIA